MDAPLLTFEQLRRLPEPPAPRTIFDQIFDEKNVPFRGRLREEAIANMTARMLGFEVNDQQQEESCHS